MIRYYIHTVCIILWLLFLELIGVEEMYMGISAIILFLNSIFFELVKINKTNEEK